MKKEVHKQLDKQLASERNKVIYVSAAITGVLLLLGALFIPISFSTLDGKAVSHHPTKSEFGPAPTATIQLDNGEHIESVWPRERPFDSNETVKVLKSTSLLGRSTYRVRVK